jgi:hypothetical protein
MDVRRLIYLLMIVTVAYPIVNKLSFNPARLISAERTYQVIEGVSVQPGEVALFWLDFGPGTAAENRPQALVILEHLFRRRIPVVLLSQTPQAEGFLTSLPQEVATRLEREQPGQTWRYGEAWVNVGFRPGGAYFMQALVDADNISAVLGRDVTGMPVAQYAPFKSIGGVEHVKLVAEVTGSVGTLDAIIQFFQKGSYRPTLVHGCTSITIPEANNFLDSKQLQGLLEGVSGAAWYSEISKRLHPASDNSDLLATNTALGVAQMMIILLVFAGNIGSVVKWWRRRYGA